MNYYKHFPKAAAGNSGQFNMKTKSLYVFLHKPGNNSHYMTPWSFLWAKQNCCNDNCI